MVSILKLTHLINEWFKDKPKDWSHDVVLMPSGGIVLEARIYEPEPKTAKRSINIVSMCFDMDWEVMVIHKLEEMEKELCEQ